MQRSWQLLARDVEKMKKDVADMKQKREEMDAGNEAKEVEFENNCNLLVDEKADNELRKAKMAELRSQLEQSEANMEESIKEFDKEAENLNTMIFQFRKMTGNHQEKSRMTFMTLNQIGLSYEDFYGNMTAFRQELEQQINSAKSGATLSKEELKQREKELGELGMRLVGIVHAEIDPDLKRQITADCMEALKCRRKHLLALKMANHTKKNRVQQWTAGMGRAG